MTCCRNSVYSNAGGEEGTCGHVHGQDGNGYTLYKLSSLSMWISFQNLPLAFDPPGVGQMQICLGPTSRSQSKAPTYLLAHWLAAGLSGRGHFCSRCRALWCMQLCSSIWSISSYGVVGMPLLCLVSAP